MGAQLRPIRDRRDTTSDVTALRGKKQGKWSPTEQDAVEGIRGAFATEAWGGGGAVTLGTPLPAHHAVSGRGPETHPRSIFPSSQWNRHHPVLVQGVVHLTVYHLHIHP